MLSLLGAAALTASIGAGAGLLAARVPTGGKLGLGACIATGVTGAILAGFVLPQLGAPVSTSLARGLATTALGAVIPLAALIGLRNANFQRPSRSLLCCLAFRIAGVLCMANAALVMISMPLARQMAISGSTVAVSTIVAFAFALAGLLALRIARQVSALDQVQLNLPEPVASHHAGLMRRLLTSLLLAGAAFATIIGLSSLGLLGRIREGFAIFG